MEEQATGDGDARSGKKKLGIGLAVAHHNAQPSPTFFIPKACLSQTKGTGQAGAFGEAPKEMGDAWTGWGRGLAGPTWEYLSSALFAVACHLYLPLSIYHLSSSISPTIYYTTIPLEGGGRGSGVVGDCSHCHDPTERRMDREGEVAQWGRWCDRWGGDYLPVPMTVGDSVTGQDGGLRGW